MLDQLFHINGHTVQVSFETTAGIAGDAGVAVQLTIDSDPRYELEYQLNSSDELELLSDDVIAVAAVLRPFDTDQRENSIDYLERLLEEVGVAAAARAFLDAETAAA